MTFQRHRIHHNTPSAVSLLLIILTWDILPSASASEAAQCCHRPCAASAPCTRSTRLSWNSMAQCDSFVLDLHWEEAFPPEAVADASFAFGAAVMVQNPWLPLFHAFPPLARGQPAASTTSNKHFTFLPEMPQRHTAVHVGWPCSFPEQLQDFQKSVYSRCCRPILSRRCFKGFSRPLCTSTRPSLGSYWATGRL